MKEQYVILTGSKNNAGDYLIKHRAKKLFEEFRADRDVVDFNAWEKFNQSRLNEVNRSKALILLGGPSMQSVMRPNIYPMVDDLDEIKVPVIMMGIGWKSINGEWSDTHRYPLNKGSLNLLRRVNMSGFQSSVRDYHTLNVVHCNGHDNFMMTGCPAYYDISSVGSEIRIPSELKKVSFSLGTSFIDSKSMEMLMKDNILKCKEFFYENDFEVVFHHSLDRKKFLSTHNSTSKHVEMHNEFSEWLEANGIKYVDVSGSSENLIRYYSNVDLHIGYRLHAHIFMNSVSKLSILISEDGRAKASKAVIGGVVLDGHCGYSSSLVSKILNKIFYKYDRYTANEYLSDELLMNIKYEKSVGFNRMKNSRHSIDNNFNVMKAFLRQLP